MSTVRGLRAIPPRLALPAGVATAAAALLVLAGARFGAAGLFFCVPAGVAALLVALRVEARQAGLRLISQQDPLTGLGNRRLLTDRLAYEIARHRRHSRRFTVFALDLDGFKQVNDRFGHAAGDEILREIARSLEKAVRDQDTVVRLGGDEFCVLAPEMGWEDAEQLAERLELGVETAVGGLDLLGVSVGFAVFPDEGWTTEHLLSRADAAALEAKRRSRRQLRAA
ncbi:MAG TPA: GGDEF domain-containing protein [Solirubrobacteraceae bacterium]|jgi:diguanylate cyclase (GGDEF)-like protein|nr:GGDEF domain-containing protein [Solirubrobacteraceae bacterium]